MTDKNQALQKQEPAIEGYLMSAADEWGATRARVLRDTVAADLEPPEFALFVEICRAKKLDPFSRQIHASKRWDSASGTHRMTVMTGIDGFRALAERTGKYEGQNGPFWTNGDYIKDDNGNAVLDDEGKVRFVWFEVWPFDEPPVAAKVEVLKRGFRAPLVGVARFQEFAATKKSGGLNHMWGKFSSVMIAKCAEAVALRRAFPDEMSGLYTDDEMQQALEGQQVAHAIDEAKRAVAPAAPNGTNGEHVEEAEYEEVPRGSTKAAGAGATKTLLLYVYALDSCESLDDVKETKESWADKLTTLPRGHEYVEAYEEHTRARVDEEHKLDAGKVHLVEAIEAMKKAARSHAPASDDEQPPIDEAHEGAPVKES